MADINTPDINMLDAVDKETDKLGKTIHPVPKPEKNIGLDISNEFWDAMMAAGDANAIDIGVINNFSQISQSRETLYQVLDTMAEDPLMAAALEVYAEDATEANDTGDIVWVESSDSKVGQYITFLLDSLNINKNIYSWVYSFIKYGDIYLRLYRNSDFNDGLLDLNQRTELNEQFTKLNEEGIPNTITKDGKPINEEAKLILYKDNDHFANYVELVNNPAEMFELTKFGKSYAYIKTNSVPQVVQQDSISMAYNIYKFNKKDIEIYNAVSFAHGCLQDDVTRIPEQVEIFLNNDINSGDGNAYSVRRGQSILYNWYKIWRQNMLLENSLLLNRLTKSAIVRLIQLEVGDMPKEKVGPALQRVKTLVEQKASVDTNNRMTEYTNPGAMENNVYVPTRNGLGAISIQQLGGDVNIRDIADIDYFKNKLYAAMKIPKQFLGDTDDATGFNGGTSLSITSSRYAKTIKRIQAAMCQTITDVINILLLDKGLDTYINKFTIKMQPPITQEELDKRNNTSSLIGISDDILRLMGDIEDPVIKLKMTKSLLANSINNQEVIQLLQEYISDLEKQISEEEKAKAESESGGDNSSDVDLDLDVDLGGDLGGGSDFDLPDLEAPDLGGGDFDIDMGGGAEESLPSPSELGVGDLSEV